MDYNLVMQRTGEVVVHVGVVLCGGRQKPGRVGTLAERWNGRNWHIQPTPVLPAVGLVNSFTAACPSLPW